MRRAAPWILVVLSGFFITAAVLAPTYVYPNVAVTPASIQTTALARTAPGDDASYFDVSTLKPRTGALKAAVVVQSSAATAKRVSSELDRDVRVWDVYQCVDRTSFDCGSGKTPLGGSKQVVAFDASTGAAVPWSGNATWIDGRKTAFEPEGQFYKLPFRTRAHSYPVWVDATGTAEPARYVRTTTVKGLRVLEFRQSVAARRIGERTVPGAVVGSEAASVTLDEMYRGETTWLVEPETGVMISTDTFQDTYLAADGERRLTLSSGRFVQSKASIHDAVQEYASTARSLTILRFWLPLVGGVLGLLCLGLGLLLGGRNRRRRLSSVPRDVARPTRSFESDQLSVPSGR